jgi:hypothetical protein
MLITAQPSIIKANENITQCCLTTNLEHSTRNLSYLPELIAYKPKDKQKINVKPLGKKIQS